MRTSPTGSSGNGISDAGAPRSAYRSIRNAVAVWLTAVILAAFLLDIPKINILEHTARNLYFHVPMWFTMMAAFFVSAYHSLRYLQSRDRIRDVRALQAARVGAVFGVLGLVTGVVWARFTWYVGQNIWWNFDPKQTMAAVQLLIYGAYFTLRSSIDEPDKRARIAAVYNLFAAATVPFLLYVLPRQMESLHPGAEGNPAFSEITDPVMRLVFYPAVIGFIGLFWILYTQRVRLAVLNHRADDPLEV
ncbi:MAG: cytochrome c biogenesis protein CcsA [Rhodothermales bacterium]